MSEQHTNARQAGDSARLVRIETLLEAIAKRDDDFETRLRRVEKVLWIGIGLSASAGSAIGSFVGNAGANGALPTP